MSIVCTGRFCGGGSWGGLGGRGGWAPWAWGAFDALASGVRGWLRAVALQIGCAGGHVLVGTNRLRTMCWLVVAGDAGAKLPRAGSLLRGGVASREGVRSDVKCTALYFLCT